MKRTIFAIAVASSLLFAGVSCNKYEEGANFSLRSAKARVAGVWHIESFTANGTDILSLTGLQEIEATKDGVWTSKYTVLGVNTEDVGSWSFNSDKTELIVVDSNGNTSTNTIVKLKNKEMKLSSTDNGVTYVMELHQD